MISKSCENSTALQSEDSLSSPRLVMVCSKLQRKLIKQYHVVFIRQDQTTFMVTDEI